MTRHKYGISGLVSQTSFLEETSGGVAECRLFAKPERTTFAVRRLTYAWDFNRPFPSSLGRLYLNAFDMQMISHSHANKTRLCTWPHFESEGFWNSEVAYLLP